MLKFQVLYTKQKTNKSKKWHDGKAHLHTSSGKLTLYDENGQVLDSTHIRVPNSLQIVGETFESTNYLIDIDSSLEKNIPSPPMKATTIPNPVAKSKPFVPPRKVAPKVSNYQDDAHISTKDEHNNSRPTIVTPSNQIRSVQHKSTKTGNITS